MVPDVSKSFAEFMKGNARFYAGGLGGAGLIFPLLDIKNVVESDNKFKAILKTIKDFVLVRAAFAGTFLALGAAIRALVKDTGSLEAAMKRLQSVQRAQRTLAPFVGGPRQARQETASLLQFSAQSPFTFESTVEASRALHAQTRGSFAGTGALTQVGDAAAASGNSLEDSAKAVGEFYAALHNGEPIHAVTDNLRQMGLISDQAATHLERLSESGASAVDMTMGLSRALDASKGGMSSYAKDLEAVGIAHEKAAEGAKAAFGAGFAEPPIRSTKNYTEALVAITPALEQVGKFFSGFTQTFETWGSKITKAAAQSGILGGAIKVLAAVATAGAIALTAFGLAVIPVVGPFAAVGAVIATTGLILYKFANQTKEAARELKELAKTHREAQAILNSQAASIQDLTGLQEQYGRSVQHIIDLQNELNEAEKKGDKGKIEEVIRALKEAHAAMANLPKAENLASPERGAVIRERLQERRDREEQRFQEAVTAQPGRRAELSIERAAVLEERAEQGRQGLQTRKIVAERQGNLLPEQSEIQTQINRLEIIRKNQGKLEQPQKDELEGYRTKLAATTGQLLKIQDLEGKNASVGLEAQVQRLQHAQLADAKEKQAQETKAGGDEKSIREAKRLQTEAVRERVMAGGVQATPETPRTIQNLQAQIEEKVEDEANVRANAARSRELKEGSTGQVRERAVVGEQIGIETQETRARFQGATQQAQGFQDLGAFLQKFESLRQVMPEDQARQTAIQERSNELMQSLPMAIKPVADSLTRVGGGGGVSGPTGDPAQRVRERMLTLQNSSLEVLKHIDIAVNKAGTPEVGGGAANPVMEQQPGTPGTPEEQNAPETAAATVEAPDVDKLKEEFQPKSKLSPEMQDLVDNLSTGQVDLTKKSEAPAAPAAPAAPHIPGTPEQLPEGASPEPSILTTLQKAVSSEAVRPPSTGLVSPSVTPTPTPAQSAPATATPAPVSAAPTPAETTAPLASTGITHEAVQSAIEGMPKRAVLAGDITAASIEAAGTVPTSGPAQTQIKAQTPAQVPATSRHETIANQLMAASQTKWEHYRETQTQESPAKRYAKEQGFSSMEGVNPRIASNLQKNKEDFDEYWKAHQAEYDQIPSGKEAVRPGVAGTKDNPLPPATYEPLPGEAPGTRHFGTKDNPLPRIPINPLEVSTKVAPIAVPPSANVPGKDYAVLSTLKDIYRSGKQSNEHLGVIADDSSKGSF
jgi:hypothetical protein